MSTFAEKVSADLGSIEAASTRQKAVFDRFRHEIDFARRLAEAHPTQRDEWEALILQAVDHVASAARSGGAVELEAGVAQAESILHPLGGTAKQYTIHCVGHAHIDMNWMWSWPETVAVTNDTFTTVDRLMDEYPDFKFSQSQASTYFLTETHLPELFERVRARVAEGRWEVTASTWVEGEGNCAMGETLCRHQLYTRRYMRDRFGLSPEQVKITWQPDLFGHPHTLPGILARAGVKRYYFCRGGRGPRLFWWQGPDGSRVLAFDDAILWYNGQITPDMTRLLFDFERDTGLKDYLFVYGVGDHGGGPTRRDLEAAAEMDRWPIWPNVVLSTTDAFFSIAEKHVSSDLALVTDELNFVFEGCYTSQSNIKRANRFSETALVEAEAVALIARGVCGTDYPAEPLVKAWRHTMFNQFHDIFPGSGVRGTYDYAQGLFQEVLATTGMVKTRSLRQLAARVDVAAVAGTTNSDARFGHGVGAGAGNESAWGTVSALDGGAPDVSPFLVFNPTPWSRTEVVTATVWDKDLPDEPLRGPDPGGPLATTGMKGRIAVVDDAGNACVGQVLDKGHYWGHNFTKIALPAADVPAMGYRTYAVRGLVEPMSWTPSATAAETGRMENEFLELHVEPASGAIIRLLDKRTGRDLVPEGRRLGLLQVETEAPHGMTAWSIGQIAQTDDLTDGARTTVVHRGPHVAAIRSERTWCDSQLNLTVSLTAGVPRIDFELDVDWLERGTPERGVPKLSVVFPLAVDDPKASQEVPCGHVEREVGGQEVPALRWADLRDGKDGHGATLVNDHKYGHNVTGQTMRLTLLRSSYDPDPLPEMGRQQIRFGLVPHGGDWGPVEATRAGAAFNHPFSVVATDVHSGSLASNRGFVALLTPGVMLSGIKQAEDSDAIVVRLYEMTGQDTEARVRFDPAVAPPDAPAVETDLLERPLESSSARMDGNDLVVRVPAYGIATVRIG
ncbi:MAG: alpha-mannosidase [Phycisphaerae bacterium]|nr:alpha-mannosidase [Phycisphaerae bacterium]